MVRSSLNKIIHWIRLTYAPNLLTIEQLNTLRGCLKSIIFNITILKT